MKKSKLIRGLREKNHVGEFREFGFPFAVKCRPNLNHVVSDKVFVDFIALIGANKLSFGGGSTIESLHRFITASENFHSPTELHREKIKKWLETHPEIAECEVGKLVDAWYDVK